MKETEDVILGESKQAFFNSKKQNTALQVLVTILLPGLIAVAGTDYLSKDQRGVALLVLVALQLIFGFILFFTSSPPGESHFQLLQQSKINRDLLIRIDKFEDRETHLMYAVFLLEDICDQALSILTGAGDKLNEWESYAQFTLEAMDAKRHEVFGFTADAKHNFAIYIYNSQAGYLEKFKRIVDNRISTSDRTFRPGIGHIGICFAKNELLLSTDLSRSAEVRDSRDEFDVEKYRSGISIPLSIGSNSPFGVLVVTSSQPNQFDLDALEPVMRVISRQLSLVYHRTLQP